MNPENLQPTHGVWSWSELCAAGLSQTDVRRALNHGDLVRIRRGWYATGNADTVVAAGVAAGGVLSCLSALRHHGIWVPTHQRKIHVRACESAHRRNDSRRFCSQYGPPEPECGAVDDVRTALRHALKCLDDEGIVVVCDSILHLGLLELRDLDDVFAAAPRRVRRLLDHCDPTAESGTETMVRLRLRLLGIGVSTQVRIIGLGRVDLLVGRRLIIEVDSEEFHDRSAAQRARDRRRDEIATDLGYIPLRLDYKRVMYEWADAEATILDIVRRRDHVKKLPRHKRGSGGDSRQLSS